MEGNLPVYCSLHIKSINVVVAEDNQSQPITPKYQGV